MKLTRKLETMPVGTKIIGGYAVVLVLMLIAMGTGFYSMSMIKNTYGEFFDVDQKLILISDQLRFEVRDQIAHTRGFIMYPDERNIYRDSLQEDFRQFDVIVQEMRKKLLYEEQHKESLEERLSLLDEISSTQMRHKQSLEKVIAKEEQGNHTEAIALGFTEIRPISNELLNVTERFGELQMKSIEHARADLIKNSNSLSLLMVFISVLALISGLTIGIYLTRSINHQLQNREAERHRAEGQLRTASLYARSLIEASLDPLVTISKEGKITDVNRGTELVTGVSRQRLIGSDFSDYFTQPEKAREGYQQVFSKGFVKDYPLAIRHISGKVTDVLYNAAVYKNEAGEVQGVFAAARDIPEHQKMKDILKAQAREMIEAVNILSSSANEILALTTQLATTASETASIVSETKSTTEEVKQTAQLSSEKARNVSDNAQKTAVVAQQGKAAVIETIAGINHIKKRPNWFLKAS